VSVRWIERQNVYNSCRPHDVCNPYRISKSILDALAIAILQVDNFTNKNETIEVKLTNVTIFSGVVHKSNNYGRSLHLGRRREYQHGIFKIMWTHEPVSRRNASHMGRYCGLSFDI